MSSRDRPRFIKAYSFGPVTGMFFLISWAGQFFASMILERTRPSNTGKRSPRPTSSPNSSHPPWRTGSQTSCSLSGRRLGLRCSISGDPRNQKRAMTASRRRSTAY